MRQDQVRTRKRFVCLFIAAVSVCLAFGHTALADGGAVVKGIRYWSSEGYTRVVMDITGSTGFAINRLRRPDRLYVDLYETKISPEIIKEFKIVDGLLSKIRSAQFDKDTVRVVMDLDSIDSYKIFRLNDPPRIVVDIFGEEGTSKRLDENPAPAVVEPAKSQTVKTSEPRKKNPGLDIFRVVIDAGHGGKDPGALGPGGIQEKDVVLDVARRVKKILEREKGYEILLTRNGDKYLELEERTVIANKSDADLFVSIHANAHRSRRLKGIETYLLNWTDDDAAMEVAARENKISFKRMKQARSEVGLILASLELQQKRDESLKLANYVQDSMISHMGRMYKGIVDKGVKQAMFYVLFGARMPSVLVEVSYITNREEAQRLRSRVYREHLARSIADGIKTYFVKSVPVQEIAKR